MSEKSYDARCYDLAEVFLADVPHGKQAAHLLALEIQETIEVFLADDWSVKQ